MGGTVTTTILPLLLTRQGGLPRISLGLLSMGRQGPPEAVVPGGGGASATAGVKERRLLQVESSASNCCPLVWLTPVPDQGPSGKGLTTAA